MERAYIAIDLKSFYASVECVDRGLDPLLTNLLVADASRTDKTICLAVSPSLKSYGISGRARLFEALQRIREVNQSRRQNAPRHTFTGKSYHDPDLKKNPSLELDFITAPPRMARYMEVSTRVYKVYLKYIAPEDIHVYSIDEVFIDVSSYLNSYRLNARELAMKLVLDVLDTTGITATAGIGSNMYLAKVAMDIVAKHIEADKNGVRIAQLDEHSYRRQLWEHRPLTDFWRVGRGIASRLQRNGIYTMGDVALCSIYNEDILFHMFGINAGLLIDHAWGHEPCTIADVKAYRPRVNSFSSSQVLTRAYSFDEARIILIEMAEKSALHLLEKRMLTQQITVTIGYDVSNLRDPALKQYYKGKIHFDSYGRAMPEHAHGTEHLERYSASIRLITNAALKIYDRVTDPLLLIRRVSISTEQVISESQAVKKEEPFQYDFFSTYNEQSRKRKQEELALEKERNMQLAILEIKSRYGKNAILKGTSFLQGATARERNVQIGGHKA